MFLEIFVFFLLVFVFFLSLYFLKGEETEVAKEVKKRLYHFFFSQSITIAILGISFVLLNIVRKFFFKYSIIHLFFYDIFYVGYFLGFLLSFLVGLWTVFAGSKINSKILEASKKGEKKALITGLYFCILVYLFPFLLNCLFLLFSIYLGKTNTFIFGLAFSLFFKRVIGGLFTKSADISLDYFVKVLRQKGKEAEKAENNLSYSDATGDLAVDLFNTVIGILCVFNLLILKEKFFIVFTIFFSFLASILPIGFIKCNDAKKVFKSYFLTSSFISLFFNLIYIKFFKKTLPIIPILSGFFVYIIGYYFVEYFTKGNIQRDKLGVTEIFLFGFFRSFFYVFIVFLSSHFNLYIFPSFLLPLGVMDALGAISDNSGFLAEKTQQIESEKILDRIDTSGNTIKAFTKHILIISPLSIIFKFSNKINDLICCEIGIYGGASEVVRSMHKFLIKSVTIKKIIKYIFLKKLKINSDKIYVSEIFLFVLGGSLFLCFFYILNEILIKNSKEILEVAKKEESSIKVNEILTKKSVYSSYICFFIILLFEYETSFLYGVAIFSVIFSSIFSITGALWDNMKKEINFYIKENNLSENEEYKALYAEYVKADLCGDVFKDVVGPVGISILTLMSIIIYNRA